LIRSDFLPNQRCGGGPRSKLTGYYYKNQDDYWEKMEFGIAACGQQNGPMDGMALHVPDIIMAP